MFIENFDKIYGKVLHTKYNFYGIVAEKNMISSDHHILRLTSTSSRINSFCIVLGIIENTIKCGIYIDSRQSPLETFDVSKQCLKSIDAFIGFLSQKIQNHE